MDFTADHFSLFRLPRQFSLDLGELEARYREMQTRVHPDKHAHLSDTERRLAMQWSTQVNEAYQVLRQPLRRAQYMLHLAGVDVQAEHNTAMPAAFLMQQMEWRESLEEARAGEDIATLETLHQDMKKTLQAQVQALAGVLLVDASAQGLQQAAGIVRQMMFQEKLLKEINDALASLDA